MKNPFTKNRTSHGRAIAPGESWQERVCQIAARAQTHLSSEEYEQASEAVSEALGVVEREGAQNDVAYAVPFLTAADVALAAQHYEESESLYTLVSKVCAALSEGGVSSEFADDAQALHCRAILGLARSDVGLKKHDRAKERYQLALSSMRDCEPAPPDEVFEMVRDELRQLG